MSRTGQVRRVLLLHGWGWDARVWREVVPLLNGLHVELCDLGYCGPARLPAEDAAHTLVVGHSLGALWLLRHMRHARWQRLLAINGFPRLAAAADFPAGVPPRVLARMQKRLLCAPAAVLDEFHAACGVAAAPPTLAAPANTSALAAGLHLLAHEDARSLWRERAADIHLLAARDDVIVPAALSEAVGAVLPAGHLRWSATGGHVLPLTQPQLCAALIRALA